NVNVNFNGDAVGNIDIFFDQLDPYGTWYDDPTYGWVFVPHNAGYLPYSNGYWKYTDYGLLWVSNDPFGWATDHYGRWAFVNRWVWAPDLTWGLSWVQWRAGDGWLGWAPVGSSTEPYTPDEHWRWVRANDLFASDLPRHYITGSWKIYLTTSVPVIRYNKYKNFTWVSGPGDAWFKRYNVFYKRERAEAAELGRLEAARRAEAERRAKERKKEWHERRKRDAEVQKQLAERQKRQWQEQKRLADEQKKIADERRKQDDERRKLEDQRRK